METLSEHIASKGGIISTKDLEGRAEYERLRRAVRKGDILRLRHGVYAEPSAMFNTMIDVEPIKLYYWKKENMEFGIEQKEISGFQVRITDLERNVCDAVKYRNKVGLDVCAEVIRSYVRLKERNLSRLSEYAQKLRLTKVMNNYLEIAIE